jgi:hypothetical protein
MRNIGGIERSYQCHLRGLSAEYEAAYGFGLPWAIPSYSAKKRGRWSVKRVAGSAGSSYLARHSVDQWHDALCHGDEAWMSTSMLEIESHAWHLHCATGNVLVAGLGMGMYLHAVAAKPEVERVVVLEIDPDVIAIMQSSTGFDQWADRDKIVIINADALSPSTASLVTEAFSGRRPDYLYADIWPVFPAQEAPRETVTMAELFHPVHAGWWGQEVEYGLWIEAGQREPGLADLEAFFLHHGIDAPTSEGYMAFCETVLEAHFDGTQIWRPDDMPALKAG